jgi:hypothetical protein
MRGGGGGNGFFAVGFQKAAEMIRAQQAAGSAGATASGATASPAAAAANAGMDSRQKQARRPRTVLASGMDMAKETLGQ